MENKLTAEEPDTVLVLSQAIISSGSDLKTKGIAHFYKGQASAMLGDNTTASIAYDEAIGLFKKIDYAEGLAMVYIKKADTFFFQQEYERADSLYDSALKFSHNLPLYHLIIDAYQKKASISVSKQETERGIVFLKKAFIHSVLKQEEYQAADIANQISTNYHAIGELDSAILYFQKLLDLKKRAGDSDGLVSDFSAIGNLYRERGEYEKAQQNLMAALAIAEVEKDSFSIITLYAEMGDIHAAQNIWRTAESYYIQSLEIARIKGRKFAEASCYKKLGDIFFKQNNRPKAVENYEAALSIYQALNNKTNTADVLIGLSKVYEGESNFSEAKILLEDALKIRKSSRDLMSTLSIKQGLAVIEINNGDVQKGIQYAKECLSEFKMMDDKEGLKNIYFLLAEAYEKAGNFKNAYHYHQSYGALKDSLNSIERTKAVKELDALYNTEKKDKEIAQKNEEIQAQQVELLQKNNQLLMLAGGLTFLVLLAVFLFFVFIKNKQLNQKRIEVLEKEKETQRLKSVIEGEEKERKRFARELHDGLGAVLATVKMQINGIKRKIPEAEALPTYQKAESLIDDACRNVREISHNLMPYVLEQQGLFFALEEMCQNLTAQHETEYDFISFGKEEKLTDVLKITLFRVVQELLKNIVSHAEAKEVIVQLAIEENEVMLVVEDDGKGFDVSTKKNGIGLENIHTRINYMKGDLEINSSRGEGSTFTVQLPL